MVLTQIEDEEKSPRTKGFFLTSYSSEEDTKMNSRDSTSCLSKVKDVSSHLLLYMTCRMLKLTRFIIYHDIQIED